MQKHKTKMLSPSTPSLIKGSLELLKDISWGLFFNFKKKFLEHDVHKKFALDSSNYKEIVGG